MENKVLVKLYVPELDTSFDVFLPVNEVIWKINKMLIKSVSSIVNIDIATLNKESNLILMNKTSTRMYGNNEILIDTDIRNGTELILMSNLNTI